LQLSISVSFIYLFIRAPLLDIFYIFQPEVRLQDSVQLLASIAANPFARESVWQFFKDNKAEFSTRVQAGILMSNLAKMVTHNFNTEQRAQEVNQFFTDNSFPGTERAVQQSVETIYLNARLLSRDSVNVKKYFETL